MKKNNITKAIALILLVLAVFTSCDGIEFEFASSSSPSVLNSEEVTGNYYKVIVYYKDDNTSYVSVPALSIPDLSALAAEYGVTPTSDNYTFAGWYAEGSGTQFTGWDEKLTENITLHAGWYVTSGNIATAFGAGGYYALQEDISYTNSSAISVSDSLVVDLNGKTLAVTQNGAYSFLNLAGSTTSQPTLVVENGTLSATRDNANTSANHADLISILNSGSVTIKNATLTTEVNGDAVYAYSTDESSGGAIYIEVADTTINLNPASGGLSYGASTGIRINTRDTSNSNASHKYTPEATVNLDNVDILDKGEGKASAMPLDFCYVEKLNVTLSECNLIMVKNHYIRVNNCGVDDANSTIDITDTNITGYEALFIRANCVNIATTITGGTITCVNQNYGTSSDTAAFAIHDGENCTIAVEGATIIMGTSGDLTIPSANDSVTSGSFPCATMLFCMQYNSWVTEYGGGNEFVFNNCDIQWTNPRKDAEISEGKYIEDDLYSYGAIDKLTAPAGAAENTITLDSVTQKSLASSISGYSVLSSDHIDYSVTNDITVDFYFYYLEASSTT